MTRNRVLKLVVLSAGALLVAACASQPTTAPLLERKFQIAAKNYQKFQHEGQVVYCKKGKVLTSAVPVTRCLTEAQLRHEVESYERGRNQVLRPTMPGAGKGGIGG